MRCLSCVAPFRDQSDVFSTVRWWNRQYSVAPLARCPCTRPAAVRGATEADFYAGYRSKGNEARGRSLQSKALARECEAQIDAQGGLPTRNPEELLQPLSTPF